MKMLAKAMTNDLQEDKDDVYFLFPNYDIRYFSAISHNNPKRSISICNLPNDENQG